MKAGGGGSAPTVSKLGGTVPTAPTVPAPTASTVPASLLIHFKSEMPVFFGGITLYAYKDSWSTLHALVHSRTVAHNKIEPISIPPPAAVQATV